MLSRSEIIIITIGSALVINLIKLPILYKDFSKFNFNIFKLYDVLVVAFSISLCGLLLNHAKIPYDQFIMWLLVLTIGLIIFYWLITNQVYVSDNDYLKTVRENSDINIMLSKKILLKENINHKTKELASLIIQNEENQLNKINEIINLHNNKDKL
jgi:hypothetical protein